MSTKGYLRTDAASKISSSIKITKSYVQDYIDGLYNEKTSGGPRPVSVVSDGGEGVGDGVGRSVEGVRVRQELCGTPKTHIRDGV